MIEAEQIEALMDLAAMRDEPLDPELEDWVEDGKWGPMLRHPLVYQIPLLTPGHANLALKRKQELIAEAVNEGDWLSVIFLHERPYRLRALIDYVTGRIEDTDEPCPVDPSLGQDRLDLIMDVWIDSENISQCMAEWTALFAGFETHHDLWMGNREAFDALPEPIPGHITAHRAGIDDGGWSWTTDYKIAEFFANRFETAEIATAHIHKDGCFGYLTSRGESEVLVRRSATITMVT